MSPDKGYKVARMIRKTSEAFLFDSPGLEKRIADLTDPPSLREGVRAVDAVVHLAAYHTFHGKKELYDSVNVQGTRALLEACLGEGVERFDLLHVYVGKWPEEKCNDTGRIESSSRSTT